VLGARDYGAGSGPLRAHDFAGSAARRSGERGWYYRVAWRLPMGGVSRQACLGRGAIWRATFRRHLVQRRTASRRTGRRRRVGGPRSAMSPRRHHDLSSRLNPQAQCFRPGQTSCTDDSTVPVKSFLGCLSPIWESGWSSCGITHGSTNCRAARSGKVRQSLAARRATLRPDRDHPAPLNLYASEGAESAAVPSSKCASQGDHRCVPSAHSMDACAGRG
jgi:hypothetical protein